MFAWIAWQLKERRKEHVAAQWLRNIGGTAISHSYNPKTDYRTWHERIMDGWLGERVRAAELHKAEEHDLTQFAEFGSLEDLSLGQCQISDISFLSELDNLDELYLEFTNVKDVSPLSNLKKLRVLWLDGTPVEDLEPLENLKHLKKLMLRSTRLSELEVEKLRKALPDCEIVYNRPK